MKDTTTAVATDTETAAAPAAEAKSEEKTVDTVKRVRAAHEARNKQSTPTTAATPAAPADKSGDATPAAKEGEEKDKPADTPKQPPAEFYSDDELIGKDLRNVDLNRVRPELRETVRKMQTAERRKHEALDRELHKARETQQPKKPEPKGEETEALYSDAEIDAILRSEKGREAIRQAIAEEVGDIDALKATTEDRILATAVSNAAEKVPELRKDEFFREVVQAIADDPEWSADFDENERNPHKLARLFRAVGVEVRDRKTAAERDALTAKAKTVETEMEKLRRAKESENEKPGSIAAKSGRRSTATSDEPETTVEFIRRLKAARGYA